MHTSAQTVRGRSTLTDVEGQFRNGSVRELKTKRKEISTAINMNSNVTEIYLKEPLSITFHASRYVTENFEGYGHESKQSIEAISQGLEDRGSVNRFLDDGKGLNDVQISSEINLLCIIFFGVILCLTFLVCNIVVFVQLVAMTIYYILLNLFITTLFTVLVLRHFMVLSEAEEDCDLFENGLQSSVICNGDNKDLISMEECRSRYAKFQRSYFRRVRRRRNDREPSRIAKKHFKQLFCKNRKARKRVRKYFKKNVPRSSVVYRITTCSLAYKEKYSRFVKHTFKSTVKSKTESSYYRKPLKSHRRKSKWKVKAKLSPSTRNTRYKSLEQKSSKTRKSKWKMKEKLTPLVRNELLENVFEGMIHRTAYCKFNLCTDVEKNPGPPPIDPSKTIHAPYSQGEIAMFGSSAGSQCVGMSLCALIYNHYKQAITSAADLVRIMSIGNELYTALSRECRQSYLMLTELPTEVMVFNTTYKIEYSPSYSGCVHGSCTIDFGYCTSLLSAFQNLIRENYNSFTLTVGHSTVSIYLTANHMFKIFDSHAKDSYGMCHSQGTCVLLEAETLNKLTEYFQILHSISPEVLFEVRGVHISEVQSTYSEISEQPFTYQSDTCNHKSNDIIDGENQQTSFILKCCCAISFYSLCFSVIKPCAYWHQPTLDAICDHGNTYFQKVLKNSGGLTINDFPNRLQVYDAEIHIMFNLQKRGTLCFESNGKLMLQKLILDNTPGNTGFLLWLYNYCFTGILQYSMKLKSTKYYLTAFRDDGSLKMFQNTYDVGSFIQMIIDTVTNEFQCNATHYCIKFLRCLSDIPNNLRQKIMRKHKPYAHKQLIANKEKQNYDQMEPSLKRQRLSAMAEWYKSLEPAKKQKELSKRVQWYKSLNAEDKEAILQKAKEREATKRSREYEAHFNNNLDHYISVFQSKINDGPFYTCAVCHRLLYRKTVVILKKEKYNLQDLFTGKLSFDGKQYICKTCDLRISKGQVPCQALHNNLAIDEIPPELLVLEKLEQILIAQRIMFEKLVVMPKGQQRKIKGAICNVPVECDQTCSILPRPPERSGIIMLKLKRKLQFRGHVYFQAVRPQLLIQALNWLKINNPLYRDITINIHNIDNNLTELQQRMAGNTEESSIDDQLIEINRGTFTTQEDITCKNSAADDVQEERDDPLNEHRASTNETCLQSVIPSYPVTTEQNNEVSFGNEIYNIAPGENKHPVSFFTDKQCEELAFPVLFPEGRYGYTAERKVKLSPVKYFNARLLHYSGRFATNPEYLFFAQFVIEQKKVADSINIALKKVSGQPISASQVRSNVQDIKNLIHQNQAYLFLRQIPGTPPYWQRFMYEVVAMVKQLGIPTWFMTLSCADLRWPELFQIISKLQGKNMSNEEIEALSYNDRCTMLNLNPVIVAKHFQYRVETFFTEVLLSSAKPIGKIVYYALRIEFQMRGSPHLHALIWTSDCPKLTHDNKQAYLDFVEQHVQANLPSDKEDPLLHDLVKTYQKHTHSKTCRKYKNIQCRFNFGHFFTKSTILAEPLSDDIDEERKMTVLSRRKAILSLVKEKIDDLLNPSKSNYNDTLTENDIFSSVGITEEEYYSALSISPDSDNELHLKRPIDSCFINNYFIAGLKGFGANVDLQPVFNHYKCITYVCSYFTKDETECSQAIINAPKEAKSANMDIRNGLKKLVLLFFLLERLALKNVYTGVCQNYG